MRRSALLALSAATALLLWTLAPPTGAHEEEKGGGLVVEGPWEQLSSTTCIGGFAGTFPCSDVDLLAYVPHASMGGTNGNDLWGWVDPLTGREYALVGERSGTAFVDVTVPTAPVYVGFLPTHNVNSTWRGIKTYGTHAYIGSEAASHGLQVFNLINLRNVTSPPVTFSERAHYAQFGNSHTIAVNEDTGYIYAAGTNTCSGGLHMVNVNDPNNPTFAGCFSTDGYTHETQCVIYNGPDTQHVGKEICFNCNEDTVTIVNVTNKSAPVQLSRRGYAGYGYIHQGWLTEDHRYLIGDDETDEINNDHNTYTWVWDVSDLDNPHMIGPHEGPTTAIDHNQYIIGDFIYQANYRAGLRILHMTDLSVADLTEVGYFDIYPADNNPSFNAAWSVYPFLPSGIVLVNGIEQGLFVLQSNVDAPGPTETPTLSPTLTPTSTRTPTRTPTSTPTRSATRTPTPTPTSTPTSTPTRTPTLTPTSTPTMTPTSTPTAAGALSGAITYASSGAPISAVDVNLQGMPGTSTQTGAEGSYGFVGLAQEAWQLVPAKSGDENDAVDSSDAVHALEAAVGVHTLAAEQRAACDATGNGSVSGLDASLILQRAVDLIGNVPAATTCGSPWAFFPYPIGGSGQAAAPQIASASCTPGSIAYNPLPGAVTQQNFTGILFGDCDLSWAAGGGGGALRESDQTAVHLGRPRIGRGALIEVPVYVDSARSLRGLDLVVRYDSVYLGAADVRSLASARGAMMRYNERRPGILRVALASLDTIRAGDKPLLLLRFKIEGRKRTVALRRAQRIAIERQHIN